jgi:hypothetical protein
MKDLYSVVAFRAAVGPAVLAATTMGAVIDLIGYQSASISIAVGVGGIAFDATNKIDFRLMHSEDGVTFDPIIDAYVQGVTGIVNGIIRTLNTPHPAADTFKVGYFGYRRFHRVDAVFSGAHAAGTPISIQSALGFAYYGKAD